MSIVSVYCFYHQSPCSVQPLRATGCHVKHNQDYNQQVSQMVLIANSGREIQQIRQHLFNLQEYTAASLANLGTVILSNLGQNFYTLGQNFCTSFQDGKFSQSPILSLRVLHTYVKHTGKSVSQCCQNLNALNAACSRLSLILCSSDNKNIKKTLELIKYHLLLLSFSFSLQLFLLS